MWENVKNIALGVIAFIAVVLFLVFSALINHG